jgi:excisionase family DNA binding protein
METQELPPESKTVTYKEFGKIFGCSRSHVNKLVKTGAVPVIPLGGKRLIARKVVDRLLEGTVVGA